MVIDIEKNNLQACFIQNDELLIMEDGEVNKYIDEYNKVGTSIVRKK